MTESSARDDYIRDAMHREFVRADFLDRLADHAGIAEGDTASREQFAAFDASRRARHETDFDGFSETRRLWAVGWVAARSWVHRKRHQLRWSFRGW